MSPNQFVHVLYEGIIKMKLDLDITTDQQSDLVVSCLSNYVILMKQYLEPDMLNHHLKVVQYHSSMVQWSIFVEKYKSAWPTTEILEP